MFAESCLPHSQRILVGIPCDMSKALVIAFCFVVLAGCGDSSTDSGIQRGTDTQAFAGDYGGTLELEVTADAISYSPHSDSGSVPIEVEITGDGLVRLIIDNYTLEGIIDNDGAWKLEVAINEFSALIDEENKDTLKKAGCPLDKPFVKIEGQITTPDMSGDVSGKLTCKILFVTIVSINFSGALVAST